MQHANAKIPEQKPAVIADAAKPIGLLIAAPWVKRDG